MGRRQFALAMFYGGWPAAAIDAEVWGRDQRVPPGWALVGFSLVVIVYGATVSLVAKWFFL